MAWVTAPSLMHRTGCLRLGDIKFTPIFGFDWKALGDTGVRLAEQGLLPEHITRAIADNVLNPRMAVLILQNEYDTERFNARGREPNWVRKLDDVAKRHLRMTHALGEGTDALGILLNVPFTGIGYVVEDGGLIEDLCRELGIWRLQWVRQLGFLHDPVVRSVETNHVAQTFNHTRYEHSLNVMAFATLIAHNNRLTRWQMRNLRAAALCHDARTPAGGDTTKSVDPPAFNEETHFPELFQFPGWTRLKKQYRLSGGLMHSIVLNKGVLGQILDVADKIAYVARDAERFLGRFTEQVDMRLMFAEPRRAMPAFYNMVGDHIRANPFPCSLWDDVHVENGQVFFTNPDRLFNFLKLRAMMFKFLYYHPAARFLEHTLASVVTKYLYDTGKVTRDELLRMTDENLERKIETVFGMELWHINTLQGFMHPCAEKFSTQEEAEAREQEVLAQGGNWMTLVENFKNGSSGGTNMLIRTEDGSIKQFRHAYPERAKRIMDIFQSRYPAWLYSARVDDSWATPEFKKALGAYRERRKKGKL